MQTRGCFQCGATLSRRNRSGLCREHSDQSRRRPAPSCRMCDRPLARAANKSGLCLMHNRAIRYATRPTCRCGKLLSRRNRSGFCAAHRREAAKAWKARAVQMHARGQAIPIIAGRVRRSPSYVMRVIREALAT